MWIGAFLVNKLHPFLQPRNTLLSSWVYPWFLSSTRRIQYIPHTLFLCMIWFNIILPGLLSGFLPLGLPTNNSVCICHHPHSCHMPSASHPTWCECPSNIWWRVLHSMQLLVTQFSPVYFYLFPLRFGSSPQRPILEYLQSVLPYAVCLDSAVKVARL
jgi:hypothetical protein